MTGSVINRNHRARASDLYQSPEPPKLTVEKGIPNKGVTYRPRGTRPSLLQLGEMDVGDSIALPLKLRSFAYYSARLHFPKMFSFLREGEKGEAKIRMWRVQ